MSTLASVTFRENLARAIHFSRLTQIEVARRSDTAVPYLCRLLKDDGPIPSLDKAQALARAVNMELAELLREE